MNRVKRLTSISLLWLAGTLACTKNTLNIPEPAPTIAGTYRAQVNAIPAPLKGESITLTIKPVTNNTAELSFRATLNGQPGDSLVYKKAYISQQLFTTDLSKGCVSYSIYLNPLTDADVLTMTCSEENTINYSYAPTGQQTGAPLKFRKI